MFERAWGEKEALLYCWWACKCVSHYGEQYGVPSKSKNRATI